MRRLKADGMVKLLLAIIVAAAFPSLAFAFTPPVLVEGDEPMVVREHQVQLEDRVLRYRSVTGRIPIRHDETGEVRGRAFFIAYLAEPSGGVVRPLTFLWNGGPTTNSILLHMEMFGPRRLEGSRLVDNVETLLDVSDLVFYDPVGTGFSRPTSDEAAAEFYSTLGDFAATVEFIRAWRSRFGAEDRPLFIGGESYGTWRVGGVAERLASAGMKLDGALLISGGIPGMGMPPAFSDAMFVPARTAAALHHRRLSPEMMRDPEATIAEAVRWARETYRPALERIAALGPSERDAIAARLAGFIGIRPELVDRTTLVVSNRQYLRALFEGEQGRTLDLFDMRRFADESAAPGRRERLLSYLRRDLGYATDLAYTGLENGYMPEPGPERRSTGSRWSYNHVEITPEMIARAQAGGGPPGSQPWLQRAMRADPGLDVFVAAGRYDSLNMCEGNVEMVATLEADLRRRFETHCYQGGHMMYRDGAERERLARDVRAFIRRAAGN